MSHKDDKKQGNKPKIKYNDPGKNASYESVVEWSLLLWMYLYGVKCPIFKEKQQKKLKKKPKQLQAA